MKLIVKAGKLRIKKRGKIAKDVGVVARGALKEAAKTFVDVLVEKTPVLTGEALGSVLPVARMINHMSGIQAKLGGAGADPRREDRTTIGDVQGGPRRQGEMFTSSGEFWQFNFHTDVFHYFLHDRFRSLRGVPTFGPVFQPAQVAMRAKLVSIFVPTIRKHLKTIIGLTAETGRDRQLSESEIDFTGSGFSPERF